MKGQGIFISPHRREISEILYRPLGKGNWGPGHFGNESRPFPIQTLRPSPQRLLPLKVAHHPCSGHEGHATACWPVILSFKLINAGFAGSSEMAVM
jgi:hypothetical protein